jgi:hypothetical protein
MKNIVSTLKQAESKIEDVVRVTYILPNSSEFEKCWPTLKKFYGEIRI